MGTEEKQHFRHSQLSSIRTPDQRVRVFVSSTLNELAEERAAARESITQLRLTPVMFEIGARPYPPRELYRAYLDQSDIFIGIYWKSYGFIAPSMKISGLEDEYNLAKDKPKLIYIKTPAEGRDPALQDFLDRIEAVGVSSYKKFSKLEDLHEHIENDVALLLTERFKTNQKNTPKLGVRAHLPLPRSRLIDREKELTLLQTLLIREDVGLASLLGPPGVGKTRLALQAGSELTSHFEDGVVFISLASLSDPASVVPAIAKSLNLERTEEGTPEDQLFEFLEPRSMLLILDNAEQIVSIAPLISRMLQAAPKLKLIVTSREALRVHNEQIVPVLPLAVPSRMNALNSEQLAKFPAVELFIERAKETKLDFSLTATNASSIIEICERLDGLPLALELAAAVLTILSPEALLARLDKSLSLPRRGAKDLPERQQTLHNTIAWSYGLLQESEKQMFRRLSVFGGGFTLDAVTAVCIFNNSDKLSESLEADEGDGLERLGQLLDKCLVQTQEGAGGEPRFSMLGTIQEYALEQLRKSGEEATLKQRHADYFLSFAEHAEPFVLGAESEIWIERLDQEDGNFRASLGWLKMKKDRMQQELRLLFALSWYWNLRTYDREKRVWIEDALFRTEHTDRSVARGRVLHAAGWSAWIEGDYGTAALRVEEGLPILQENVDKRTCGYAKILLGLVRIGQRNSAAARPLLEESCLLFTDLHDERGEAFALYYLGMASYFSGDRNAALTHYEASLELFRKIGSVFGVTMAKCALEAVTLPEGDEETSRLLYEQSLPLLSSTKNRGRLGTMMITLGDNWLRLHHGEEQAKTLYKQGLQLLQDMKEWEQGVGVFKGLVGVASVEMAQGQAERAGRLFGAANHLLPVASKYREDLNSRIKEARTRLDPQLFMIGWKTGETMTEEQAITEALK